MGETFDESKLTPDELCTYRTHKLVEASAVLKLFGESSKSTPGFGEKLDAEEAAHWYRVYQSAIDAQRQMREAVVSRWREEPARMPALEDVDDDE
jgi:hypothetical protein